MKRFCITAAAIITTLALVAARAQAPQRPAADGGVRIAVQAETIEAFEPRAPERSRFGELEFRGGLILTSSSRVFGGLSAIRVSPDGARLLALSDKGQWFRGRIVYRAGRPVALEDVETAPMLGPDGRQLAARGWYDTESITEDNGTIYVGIERVHQIVRFDFAKDGFRARGIPIAVPPEVRRLPSNKGLECLAMPAKGMPLAGSLIAISERGLDAEGNLRAFLIGGGNAGLFAVRRTDEFDVSDCTTTPRGDLLILERRFTLVSGVAMRIRRIPLSRIRPGVVVDGEVLIYADLGFQIDNMEGIAVHRSPQGDLVLTLISDDNFSAMQRTLLLQFTLVGE
jgi:hypothetical protein